MTSEQLNLDAFLREKENEANSIKEISKDIQNEILLEKKDTELTLKKIKELYENGKINKNYAIYLSTTLFYDKNPEEYLQPEQFNDFLKEKYDILRFLCRIFPKSKKIFKLLEDTIISHRWYNLRVEAMDLLEKYYPEKTKKVNFWVMENDLYLIPYILKYHKTTTLRKLAKYISNPVVKLYFHGKWFFEKYHFRFNAYEKRLFGPSKNNFNIKMKVQTLDGPYKIFNDTGIGIKYPKKYSLSELLACKIKNVDIEYLVTTRKLKVLDIYQQKRYFYGITYKFFNKLIKYILKIFDVKNEDFSFTFVRNYSVSFLYLEIPKIHLAIIFPAKKFKKILKKK